MKTVIALAAFAAALVTVAEYAWPHSWYPQDCCNDQDCIELPLDAVTETATGWHVEYDSPKLGKISVDVPAKHHRVQPSQDGMFHGCFYHPRYPGAGGDIAPGPLQFRCFFYPVWM
jgi:hypothetical protein